jgi:hypothetical protein
MTIPIALPFAFAHARPKAGHDALSRCRRPFSPCGRRWASRQRSSDEGWRVLPTRALSAAHYLHARRQLLHPHPSLLRNDTFPRQGGRGANDRHSPATSLRAERSNPGANARRVQHLPLDCFVTHAPRNDVPSPVIFMLQSRFGRLT